jgi:hypothetical protein
MEYDLDDKPEVGDAAVFGCCCIRMLLYPPLCIRRFICSFIHIPHFSLHTSSFAWLLTMADYG